MFNFHRINVFSALRQVRNKSGLGVEAPFVDISSVISRPEESAQKKKLAGTISVPTKVNKFHRNVQI